MSPVQKQRFKNQSAGWVGAVNIGPKGDEKGVAIAPGAEVWLSEDEKILTANAPKKAEDSPFMEQTFTRINRTTGKKETYKLTPLVLVSADRFVPGTDRPVPGGIEEPVTTAAPEPVAEESSEVEESSTPPEPPEPPARAAQAAALATQAAKAAEAASEAPEETAASSPGPQAEETGAAPLPTGEPPHGEYSKAEEVGTPVGAETAGQPAPYAPPQE